MDMTMLKAHLGEELYARVEEKLGGLDGFQVIATNDGSWMPKARLDAEIAKRKELQAAVNGLNGQLDEARQKLEESGALQGRVDRLTAEVAERDKTIRGMRRSGQIREALTRANIRDAALGERILDTAALEEDGAGNLAGLEEQIRALRERSPYLFADPEPTACRAGFIGGRPGRPAGEQGHEAVNRAIRAAAGKY